MVNMSNVTGACTFFLSHMCYLFYPLPLFQKVAALEREFVDEAAQTAKQHREDMAALRELLATKEITLGEAVASRVKEAKAHKATLSRLAGVQVMARLRDMRSHSLLHSADCVQR